MFSRRILFKPRGSPFDAIWQPSHGCHCSSGPKRFSTKFSEIPDRAETKEEYTLDGKKRLRELMQHNIGLNGELKPSLRTRDLTVHIAARHVVQWSDLNYFTTSGLAYAEAVCRRYVAHTAQPLWWRTQALSATARPVIRNKATARMNAAFKEALHNAGYDTQGRRLPNQQEKPGDEATKGLSGTVVIKSHLPVEFHKIPFKDLQEFCARAVKAVEEANSRHSGNTSRGSKAGHGPRQGDRGHSGRGSRGGSGGKRSSANKAGDSSQRRPQRGGKSRDTT